jgi:hypothetical protein
MLEIQEAHHVGEMVIVMRETSVSKLDRLNNAFGLILNHLMERSSLTQESQMMLRFLSIKTITKSFGVGLLQADLDVTIRGQIVKQQIVEMMDPQHATLARVSSSLPPKLK